MLSWLWNRRKSDNGKRYKQVRRALCAESLEQREMLHRDGLLPGNSAHLTLSFVPDGTDVAGIPSALFSTLGALAANPSWQETVLRAFQTWSAHTNADVGLVPDNGETLGAAGPRQLDARFGDVRVAAVPLSPDVMAISIPNDALVAGSWVGDVLINSTANFASLDELYTVMVHEAGHVFGLDHSDDPLSPMHIHGPAAETLLTPTDIQNLQSLYGERVPDVNEDDDDDDERNDSFSDATGLDTVGYDESPGGTAPAVAFGDISRGDRDFFVVDIAPTYQGPVTFTLRTRGLSALDGKLRVYDQQQNLVAETSTVNPALRRDVAITVNNTSGTLRYFAEVVGRDTSDASLGGYALIVTHDDRLLSNAAEIDQITSARYRFSSPDDLEDFFEEGEDPLLDDDQNQDDNVGQARELLALPGYGEDSRYEINATLTTPSDLDYYSVRASSDANVMLVNVRTWAEPVGLIPRIAVFDDQQRPVAFETLLNGAGELAVQVRNVDAERHYIIRVGSATSSSSYAVGNYRLAVRFAAEPFDVPVLASGNLNSNQPRATHSLYVAQPQIFHFLLSAQGTNVSATDAVFFTISDVEQGITVASGDQRSLSGTLLGSGTYELQFFWANTNSVITPGSSFTYELRGATVSSPFGVIPIEPLDEPEFQCGALDPRFCFPNGVVGTTPYSVDANGQIVFGEGLLLDPAFLLNNWWRQQPIQVDASSLPGDANRDGVFDSADLIAVFRAGQFEDSVPRNSTWETGDWNGDRDFTTADLIAAFQIGAYQR
jgi:hypothetical protein